MKSSLFRASLFLAVCLLCLTGPSAWAQRSDISFGYNMNVTTSNAYGVYVWPRFRVSENLKLGLNVGALFRSNSFGSITENITLVPTVATLTFAPESASGRVRPFVGVGMGALFAFARATAPGVSNAGENNETDFFINMHAGLDIDLSESAFLQIATGYDMFFESFLGETVVVASVPVRLGVGFRIL